MKTRRWEFTPDEWSWVWTVETGLDINPYPIRAWDTPTTADEFRSVRAAISAALPAGSNPDLSVALGIAARPELRIVCTGRLPDRQLRTLGAVGADIGVVVCQEPTGAVTVVSTPVRNMGKAIAATFPDVAAGGLPEMVGYTERIRSGEQVSYFESSAGSPAEQRIRRLLMRAPRSGQGEIRIDPRPDLADSSTSRWLYWLDITDTENANGRYLIDVGHDTTVRPADRAKLAQEIWARCDRRHVRG